MKKLLSGLLCLGLMLLGCSHSSQESLETKSDVIEVEDQAGRTLTLDQPVEKIVSSYYITTYGAMALGLKDNLVGIEDKAASRAIYKMAAPELLELPSVGTLKAFNVEAAIALEPDLVLLPNKLIDHAEALNEVGIDVLVVNPESQELLEEMLMLIGKVSGHEEQAAALIQHYDDSIAHLNELLKESEPISVYMAANSSYTSVAANQMYQANLIELAHGVNAAASIEGDYWTEVSYEDILVMNPDVIIIPSNAEYGVEDVMNDSQLQEVTALKNKAVYQMPKGIEEWDSPIPSSILGVEWLASVLHEDVYPFDVFKEDVVEFYQTFYGFEIDRELITK